jgi:Bacterial regulatory proteins, luxR family
VPRRRSTGPLSRSTPTAACGQPKPCHFRAGGDIGIAEAAVKVHRSCLMQKIKARSLPALNRMADKLKLAPDEPQQF